MSYVSSTSLTIIKCFCLGNCLIYHHLPQIDQILSKIHVYYFSQPFVKQEPNECTQNLKLIGLICFLNNCIVFENQKSAHKDRKSCHLSVGSCFLSSRICPLFRKYILEIQSKVFQMSHVSIISVKLILVLLHPASSGHSERLG